MATLALSCLLFAAGLEALVVAVAGPWRARPVPPVWGAVTAAASAAALAAALQLGLAGHVVVALALCGAGQLLAACAVVLVRAANEGGADGGGPGGGPSGPPPPEPPPDGARSADWEAFERSFWRHVDNEPAPR